MSHISMIQMKYDAICEIKYKMELKVVFGEIRFFKFNYKFFVLNT